MNITLLLLLGVGAGIAANFIDPRSDGGVVGPIVLGIMGGVIGTILGTMVLSNMGIGSFAFESLIIPSLGSLGLLFLARVFKREGNGEFNFKIKLPKEVRQAWF